ncbi:LIM and calponin domain-containing protein [Salix suchowensis]|nr:LIM and calponin domain-containing protein [Salix suchowensis]
MSKLKRSQILVLSLLAALLVVTPLIPSSLRPKYLYFIFNLLIIALGAEAGLISAAFSKPVVPVTTKPARSSVTAPPDHQASAADQADEAPAKAKVFVKSASENYGSTVIRVDRKVKKCPSLPSLFFIGGGDHGAEAVEDVRGGHEEEGEGEGEVGGISGQELYTKAETFIGNFYKQLKMQREESWKKIHGFYHKAF